MNNPTPPPTPGTGTAQTPTIDPWWYFEGKIGAGSEEIAKMLRGNLSLADMELNAKIMVDALNKYARIESDLTTAQHQLQEARAALKNIRQCTQRMPDEQWTTIEEHCFRLSNKALEKLTTSEPKEKEDEMKTKKQTVHQLAEKAASVHFPAGSMTWEFMVFAFIKGYRAAQRRAKK